MSTFTRKIPVRMVDPPRVMKDRRVSLGFCLTLAALSIGTGLYYGGIKAADDATQAWAEAEEAKRIFAEQKAGASPLLVELGRKQRKEHP